MSREATSKMMLCVAEEEVLRAGGVELIGFCKTRSDPTMAVVLGKWKNQDSRDLEHTRDEWATWRLNLQSGGLHLGRYTTEKKMAERDFFARITES